nr:Retrotransposable element Tf2 [Ipomoea batatas]
MAENTNSDQVPVDDPITDLRNQLREQALFQHQTTQVLQRSIQQLAQSIESIKLSVPPHLQPPNNALFTSATPQNSTSASLPNEPIANTHRRHLPLKIDLPKFDGADPHAGEASEWLRWMKNNNLLRSWPEFLDQVRLRFDASHFEDFFGSIIKDLPSNHSHGIYRAEYEKLLNKVTNVPEVVLISMFVAGLKSTIRREVQRASPLTLIQAFSLASEVEAQQGELRMINSSDAFQQLDMVDEHVLTGDCSSLNSMADLVPRVLFALQGPSIMRVYRPSPPFRVYIGNGDSLQCSHSCPDVHYHYKDICFRRYYPFARRTITTLNTESDDVHSCFELSPVPPEESTALSSTQWPDDIPPEILTILQQHALIFGHSLARRFNQKLACRYYGPFPVLERIGAVAYRLQLPDHVQIHPVFHVSLLRPFRGPDSTLIMPLPTTLDDGRPVSVPVAIHEHRQVLRHGVLEEQSVGAME